MVQKNIDLDINKLTLKQLEVYNSVVNDNT